MRPNISAGRLNSCSGCGRKDHRVRACNSIGVILHGFINEPVEEKALQMISWMTFGALDELRKRLNIELIGIAMSRLVNRYELINALRMRWRHIQMQKMEMVAKGWRFYNSPQDHITVLTSLFRV